MTAHWLEEIYRRLTAPPAGALSARSLPGSERYRVGRGADGAPRLLIEVGGAASDEFVRRLRHIEYRPRELVSIEEPGSPARQGVHAVLACLDADEDLRAYFFRIAWLLIERLGAAPSPEDVDRNVATVLQLFRNLEHAGTSTIQGLWAELLLIARAPDVRTAAAAWHAKPREKFDFVSGNERLEVKSTLDEIRIHQVSLEQIRPTSEGPVVLASFILTRARDGATVGDLIESIGTRLAPHASDHELIERIETVVSRSVGEQWQESATARFDIDAALESLRVFDARVIPSVDPRFPPEVRDVRFGVDLSSVPSLPREQARELGPFFDAVLPRA